MKALKVIIMALFLISPICGQSSDNVNIDKMVKTQIEDARKKMKHDKSKTMEKVKVEQQNYSVQSYDLTNEILILGGASLFVFVVIYVKRRIEKRKQEKKRIIKQGVMMMRSERVYHIDNPTMSSVRSKLSKCKYSSKASGKDIVKMAKLLNISQGEIVLVKKIASPKRFIPTKIKYRAISKNKNDFRRVHVNRNPDMFGKVFKDYLAIPEPDSKIDYDSLLILN